MDSQSIITQAGREDSCSEFPILSLPRPVPPAQTAPTCTPTNKKKKSRGRRLAKLFCCFGHGLNRKPHRNLLFSASSTNHASPDDLLTGYRGQQPFLLPSIRPSDVGKKCVVIDLDETLVHSSFKRKMEEMIREGSSRGLLELCLLDAGDLNPVYNADFVIPVEIEGTVHQVYVLKRPYVDEFLQKMGEMFECVLFTASLAKYADPVSDLIDKWGVFRARLFRDSCMFHRGNFVKDLSRLGRDLSQVVIIDNSPASYVLHPENAVAVTSWFDDMGDTELLELLPMFEGIALADTAYSVLRNSGGPTRQSLQCCTGRQTVPSVTHH